MTLSTSTVTLAPGSSRTYTLAPGEAVTVATEPNCFVTVTETPEVIASADLDGQTNVRTSILQYEGEWTYGPYALGGTVAVAVSLSKSTSSVSVTLGSTAAAVVEAAGIGNRSFVLTNCRHGTFVSTARLVGDVNTTHIEMALESEFDQVRIATANQGAAALTVKMAAAVSSVQGAANSNDTIDPTLNGGTWVDATFAGASSVSVPAYPSGGKTQWQFSDWMDLASIARTDGGDDLPVLHVRVEVVAGTTSYTLTNESGGLAGWESVGSIGGNAPYGRMWRARTQAVAGVTTKAAFTDTTSAAQHVPVLVQYRSRKAGYTIVLIGDSIIAGQGASLINNNAWFRAACALSTPERPISVCNLAVAGQAANFLAGRVETLNSSSTSTILAEVAGQFLVTHSFWTNDNLSAPLTAAEITTMRRGLSRIRGEAMKRGMRIIQATAFPAPTRITDGTDDALRVALSDAAKSEIESAQGVVWDVRAQTATVSSGKEAWVSGLTSDNVHPDEDGYVVMTDSAEGILRGLILRPRV